MSFDRKWSPLALPVSLCALIATAIGLVAAFAPKRTPAAAPSASPVAKVAYPRGGRWVYDARWSESTRVAVPTGATKDPSQDGVSGVTDFAARFELRSHGKVGDGYVLSATAHHATTAKWLVAGRDLAASTPELFNGVYEAQLTIDDAGTVRSIGYRKGVPESFRRMIEPLVHELSIYMAQGDQWTDSEATPFGRARTRYSATAPLTFDRKREAYESLSVIPPSLCTKCPQKLANLGHLQLDPQGLLVSADEQETLAVEPTLQATRSVTMKLVESGTWEPPASLPADVESHPLGIAATGNSPEAMLARRVNGLTWDDLTAGIEEYEKTGELDPSKHFVTRASGLLLQHPEDSAKLLAVFTKATVGVRTRALVLDILASAGDAAAQATMRDALGSPSARTDMAAFPLLVQRFSLVAKPDPASLEWASALHARAISENDRSTRTAALYTMGAMAAKSDASLARAYDAKIRAQVEGAKTPADKRDAIIALGNVRRADDVPYLVKLANDTSSDVRIGVARALEGKDSTKGLVGLLADSDGKVGNAAVDGLSGKTLDSSDMHAVATVITSGKTSSDLDGSIVELFGKHPEPAADARAVLDLLAARAVDPKERARIAWVRAQLDAKSPPSN